MEVQLSTTPSVHDVDLPWTKLRDRGVEGCSDDELLAVILRSGYGCSTALANASSLLRTLPLPEWPTQTLSELGALPGVTARKAETLAAAFELTKRALKEGLGVVPSITQPRDAIPFVADIRNLGKEHFLALFLNGRHQIIHREDVSVGSQSASLVHPREVFAPAVGTSAASVILAHNHPSGDPSPSQQDVDLTRRLVQAGEILGIDVLDHLIVTGQAFSSMKELGML